jgi:hypothetical protein
VKLKPRAVCVACDCWKRIHCDDRCMTCYQSEFTRIRLLCAQPQPVRLEPAHNRWSEGQNRPSLS